MKNRGKREGKRLLASFWISQFAHYSAHFRKKTFLMSECQICGVRGYHIMFDSVCVKPSDWRKLWCKLSKSTNHRELVYHDEVFKTILRETKTMQLFLSPFWTILVHGTAYRTVQRLCQFLNFFPLLGISAVSLSAKQPRKPCSRSPPVYQDLSMRHDWSVKNAIVDLPIRIKEFWNTLLVIHRVCWVPRTRILVLLCRQYLPAFNYICDASDLQHPSMQALGLPTPPTNFKSCQQPV